MPRVEGDKKMEFTVNFKAIRLAQGTMISEKLLNTAKESSNDFLTMMYLSVSKFISELEKSDDANAKSFLSCLESSDSCSYVYWGCGSCGGDGARVDAYCGSGGSQPDYSWCEQC